MSSATLEWVKVSARMPKNLLDRFTKLYPKKSLSELLRALMEREIIHRKTLKAHLKLYGRFKKEHFDESLL